MAAAPTSVLSKTLKSISETKIREIDKLQAKYEQRKDAVLAEAAIHKGDPSSYIAELLKGVEELCPEALKDIKVSNVKYWLQQSKYDASIPPKVPSSCEELVRDKLEIQSRRLGLAHLYSRLVTEWMEPGTPMSGEVSMADNDDDDGDSFEHIDRQKERLQALCQRFEEVVFTPLDRDAEKIREYLNNLFPGEQPQRGLNKLRENIRESSESLMNNKAPFDKTALNWAIKALLAEEIVSEEKRAMLRDFQANDVVLSEIVDVLNMRYADFDNWEWDAGPDGIPILPRQQLNGKYRIWMDEDVLQAIFVEFIGVKCCVLLHSRLSEFLADDSNKAWNWSCSPNISWEDNIRRKYYLGRDYSQDGSVDRERQANYKSTFFLSQLPSSTERVDAGSYNNDGVGNDKEERAGFSSIKQSLLRTLATEVLMRRTIDQNAAVVQSDLQWFATGLSHTTIFEIMRFFGFPERLITFYRKVLRAPLNMTPSQGNSTVRIRERGVHMAHATEKIVGELLLFAMDQAVNKETGMLLYRLHDDLFLVGTAEKCALAWETMRNFASVMGLEFNRHKTGSVYLVEGSVSKDAVLENKLPSGPVQIGHLTLDGDSGKWMIDQKQVGEHVAQLKKQLDATGSILAWIQTWNSCIGRFFSHTFGEPGYCFGRDHIDNILETYQEMNRVLFGGNGNASDYLRAKISERFGVGAVPEAFLLLPEELGGLSLRNPFIPLLVARERFSSADESPEKILQKVFQEEKEAYESARKAFENLGELEKRLKRLQEVHQFQEHYDIIRKQVYENLSADDLRTFFPFDEYIRYRDSRSAPLQEAYRLLIQNPGTNQPNVDSEIKNLLYTLSIKIDDGKPKSQQTRWALQMFGDELRQTVGGLRLVEDHLLPLGVITMMRTKTVRWNMVL